MPTRNALTVPVLGYCEALLSTSSLPISSSPISFLDVLRDTFDASACSFYSYSPTDSLLCLRAQRGLSYDHYGSFQLPLDSPAGAAIRSKDVEFFPNLSLCPDYRDKSLLTAFGLTSMFAIPLTTTPPHSSRPSILGVICLYPPPSVAGPPSSLHTTLRALAPLLGRIYQLSIDHTKLLVREAIIQHAVVSTDSASFFHRALFTLQRLWPFQGASVFIIDPRANVLRLRATTKLATDLRKLDVFYKLSEPFKTPHVFKTCETMILNHYDGHTCRASKFLESVPHSVISSIIAPIRRPGATPGSRGLQGALGVTRFVNRVARFDDRQEIVGFAEDDVALVDFIGGLFGVIAHLYSMISRKADDFERAIHGLHTNIVAVQARLHQVQAAGPIVADLPSSLGHHIPDCIAIIESISQQVSVFHTSEMLEARSFNCRLFPIYVDVLSKIPPLARLFGKTHSVEAVSVDQSAFSGDVSNKPPLVYGDTDLLMTVFRNLSENAVKYSSRGAPCRIKFLWKADDAFVYIYFLDNGIGIRIEDKEDIFLEGFQSENLLRRQPSGTGLGLFQSKQIMTALGGDIYYVDAASLGENTYTTAFTIKIPRYAHT